MNRPAIIARVSRGQALAAVEHLRDTLNWAFGWVANVKAGNGITILSRDTDHPTIKANIIAGAGITISTSGGAIKISVTSEQKKDSTKPENPPEAGGGGHGGHSNEGTSAGGDGGGASSDGGSSSGGGGSGGSSDGSNDCNQWSIDGVGTLGTDSGMTNTGDSCSELNGW